MPREKQFASRQISQKLALVVFSALASGALVVAAFRVTALGWIVDAPGWIVSRFVSVDFHEGDGALGFLLAILLSWLWIGSLIFLLSRWCVARWVVARSR